MKNGKIFQVEKALNEEIANTKKIKIIEHLRKNRILCVAVTDTIRAELGEPETVKAYNRELATMQSDLQHSKPEERKALLEKIRAKHPNAQADTIAHSAKISDIMNEEIEIEFLSAPSSLVTVGGELSIGATSYDLFRDVGIFTHSED